MLELETLIRYANIYLKSVSFKIIVSKYYFDEFNNIFLFFFCSYDSREMTDLRPDRPDLWSEPSAFGDRAHFRVTTKPAVLSVTGVQRFDAGTYTCRVDFRQSPTVYHHVKLDVIGKQDFFSLTT